jgi:TonB family protein
MKIVLLAVLSLTACATGSIGIDREPTTRTGVRFQLVPGQDAPRVFPSVIEPALPSADRLAHHVRVRFGEVIEAELDVCVAPSGEVTTAKMATSTGDAALDAAIERDASAWKFDVMPGPAGVQSCERARLTYRAPR